MNGTVGGETWVGQWEEAAGWLALGSAASSQPWRLSESSYP